MLIQYCPRCAGRPYSCTLDLFICPICGAPLEMENVTETSLAGREKLDNMPLSSGNFDFNFSPGEPFNGSGGKDSTSLSDDNGIFGVPDPMRPTKREPKPVVPVKPKHEDPPVSPGPAPIIPPTDPNPDPGPVFSGAVETNNNNRRIESNLGTTIRGRISQYSSSGREDGHYRRPLVTRLADAVLYRQRFEDVLHRFTVRVKGETDIFGNSEYFDVPVNVHGTIAGGIHLTDNNEVEVTGRYRDGVLMAQSITVISNGYRTSVRFQHSIGAIVTAVIVLIALVFGMVVLLDSSNGGGIWQSIAGFLKTWGIFSLILFVLYLMFCFSTFGFRFRLAMGSSRRSPLPAILLLGLILTVLVAAKFGTAANLFNTLLAFGAALLPTVVLLLLTLYCLFRIIFPK